ncbi:DUF2726 domain-containing protein [Roseimicrobium gellanilyticum]|nr:DUF2726 domain-containing protein [Roseimicrobium gellanilyticum]
MAKRNQDSSAPVVSASTSKGVTVDYRSKVYLMSKTERSFFGTLQEQMDGKFVVFSKVRLADIVKPVSVDGPSWWTAFHQLSSKHIDFVICDPASLALVCCIELDDASHERDDRKGRDGFVDATLAAAGIPFLRFAASKGINSHEIREKFWLTIGAHVP